MSKNLSSSRVFASRIALVAVIAGLLLSFAGAATNAANFSIVDSVRGLFGLASSNSVVPQSEIKLSDGEDPTAGTVSLTTLGSAYTQNFDTLSNTAGSTTNVIAITGWDLTETGGGARDNEQYAVDTGGSTTGDTYSYGAAASTERAFGGLQSGTLIPVIGASFTNNTGSTITSANIAYTGEEWRLGTQSRADRIDFQYSTDATSLTTGTWIDVDALDFTTPNTGATVGALDGNAAANRTAISNTIGSLNIPNGATFWIRYNDLNATGADDGLAIDDFSLTPNGSVTPTPTNTPTHTPTNTPTATPTNTPTATPTNTPTATPTNTPTATPTDTPTATPTATPSASPTASATPVFSISDVSLNEGNFTTTTFTFTITKTGENGSVSTVYYATQDGTANGTANSGNDYNSLGGLPPAPEGGCGAFCVEFLPGETSKTVDVIVNGDTNVETDETFFLNLVSVSNGVLGDSSGLGTIVNDDTPGSHTLYGIANGFGVPSNNQIYTIDALTGSATNFHPITVQGFIVRNSIALAERPADGAIFGVLVLDLGNPVRPDGNSTEGNLPTYHLVTINPATGVATDIGPLAQEIQSLSFRPFANRNSGEGQSNTLYGISGNTGSSPRTLFAVDTSNAALSTVMALNNGSGCGQAIAFSDNGFLYHAAGGTCYLSSPSVEGGVFERVNVDTQDVVFVGPITTEVFALGYSTAFGQMFLNEGNGDLYTISLVNGFKNFIGTIAPGMRGEGSDAGSGLGQPLPNRGLAFAPGVGSISMVKTVGLDPETCGVANALSVSAGTTVYYCYTVTNTGGVAFTNHSLYDDVLGTILNGYSFLLNPGQSMHVISAPYVVTETITNTATWVADTNSGGGKRPGGGKTRPEGGGGGGAQAQSMSPVTVAVNGTCQNYAKTTPAFDFTEINATGTQISLGDDDMSGAIPVGFNFNYFGTTYTDVYVSSNGFLTVLPGQSPTFVSAPMTNPGDPNGVIAPFWNDLYPPAAPVGGGVIYQTVGSPGNRVLIVEYKSIPNFGSSNPDYTFQVKLFENGNAIEFHYLTTNNDGSFGSAGIENETGTLGKQFYLGTGNIPDNTAVRYAPCGAATPTPTATPTPCAGGSNIIVDGGFEAGSPWPGWTTQTSTNFGTSICNTSNCNSNSGNTAPRTGTNWLWFGGGTGGQAENSTNGQSFVIPAGTAELRFWMKVQNVITPFSDTMTVRIDGNPVQVFTEPATAEAAYTERVINLSAFANGASHSLVFDYVGTDGASNFLIDDISVIASGSCVPASQADLAIVKTDGVTNVSAGGSTTYTITVTNNGPDPAVNAIVQDLFPAGVIVDNWSCLPQNSAFCTLAGAGNINDTVYIPVGGILTYTALARLNPNQVGTLVNTATVTPPSSVTDPNLANNTSTDTDNFVVTLSGNVKQYVAGGPNANLAGVTMTLGPVNATTVTDASGNYSFANLNAGQSWTITPTMAGKVFDTVSRTFNNVTADIGGINFIAYNTNGIPRNISVVNSFATPGNTVTVPIRMTSQGTEKTMSFSLDYPLGVLNTPVVTCGVSTPGCAVTSTNVTPGKLGVTITAASAVAAGLREIANITFQTNVGFAPPNAALNFSDTPTARLVTDPLGDTLQATFANGFVIFVDGVEGDVVGRPSGDGTVVSTDVTQIRRFVAGLDTPDASVNEFQRADVAPIVTWGDGLILPGDVVQARRYSARLDLQQAAAGPGGPALPPLGTGTAPVEEVAAVATSRAIGVTTVNSDPGSRVSVNVELAPQGDEAAMSFTVAFDASRLRNPQVSLAGGMGDGAVLTVNSNDADRGRIGILVDSTEALAVGSAARPVITVTFDVTGDATGGLARVRLTDGVAPRGVAGIMGDTLDARYTDGGVVISGPAAAGVEMSGRVTTSDGRGVRNATVTIIDGNGYARTVVTSTFGYYRFDGVMPGEMYSIGVLSRNYHFAPRTFTVGDNLADVDFTAVD